MFKIGDYFLSGPWVYQVDRLTKQRAYVHRIQGIDLRHALQGSCIVSGGDKFGLYIEWMADWQIEQHERKIMRLPVSTDDEAIGIAVTARAAMKPYSDAFMAVEKQRSTAAKDERSALMSAIYPNGKDQAA
jgi:hypothetical protein